MITSLATPVFRNEGATTTLTASGRIRQRLREAGHRFHANDNIAAFLRAGELDELRGEVEARMHEVLRALVIDTARDHNTVETARRVAKMFIDEVFRGRYEEPPEVTSFPNAARLNGLMIVGPTIGTPIPRGGGSAPIRWRSSLKMIASLAPAPRPPAPAPPARRRRAPPGCAAGRRSGS